MSMELDELKQAWAGMALRQEGLEAMWQADLRDRRMDKTRAILRWSLAGLGVQLAAWLAFTVLAASFWVDHRHVVHWLLIGLLLHAYGIAGIWASATQLLLLSRIYLFDAPVLVLQRRLAQLRRFRVWCTLSLGLPWWCLWLLVPMAVAQALAGADGYAAAPGWFWSCMAVGVAGMGLSVWLARRLAGRRIDSPLLRRIVDDMSGCALRRASRQLDELARFERGD
jgi:hypothetical protein